MSRTDRPGCSKFIITTGVQWPIFGLVPISPTWFHSQFKFDERFAVLLFHLWQSDRYTIFTKLCTCHDSTAVVTCAKLCSDHKSRMWYITNQNLHHIWWKTVSEIGPCRWQARNVVLRRAMHYYKERLKVTSMHCIVKRNLYTLTLTLVGNSLADRRLETRIYSSSYVQLK